ncbi:SxtJ family membrane protein [Melioribacter sp. OK-6-Me]|uniref:SxtJ family membrane protein n=1 Tax=unclassified Melioribacter TaxID=2627329 RepID=UPI003ED9D0AB
MNWIKNITEEISNLKPNKNAIKKFPLIIGSIFLLIYIYFYFFTDVSYYLFLFAGILASLGYFLPVKVIYPFYKGWMSIAVFLSYFMSRLTLIILFYLIITPLGLILRLSGKNFLELEIEKERRSYWNKKEKENISDPEKQF